MPLAELVAPLHHVAFSLGRAHVTRGELAGDITGVVCVALLARQHILSWPLGLINNVFFFVLFLDAKLYADALLQIVFFALGVYGWATWARNAGRASALPVGRASSRQTYGVAVLTFVVGAAMGSYLARFTDSPAPYIDASVLALSLAATYGQARKLIESWWVWITVDVISVPLCLRRELYPTALLYVVYGVLCVVGLRAWSRDARTALRSDALLLRS